MQRFEFVQRKRATSSNPFHQLQVLSSLIEYTFQNRIPYNFTPDPLFKIDESQILEHSALEKTIRSSDKWKKTIRRAEVVNKRVNHSWQRYSSYLTSVECWSCKKVNLPKFDFCVFF